MGVRAVRYRICELLLILRLHQVLGVALLEWCCGAIVWQIIYEMIRIEGTVSHVRRNEHFLDVRAHELPALLLGLVDCNLVDDFFEEGLQLLLLVLLLLVVVEDSRDGCLPALVHGGDAVLYLAEELGHFHRVHLCEVLESLQVCLGLYNVPGDELVAKQLAHGLQHGRILVSLREQVLRFKSVLRRRLKLLERQFLNKSNW